MYNNRKKTITLLLFIFFMIASHSANTIEVALSQNTIGSIQSTPFWMQANRWGLYSDSEFQSSIGLESSIKRDLSDSWKIYLELDVDAFVDDDEVLPRLQFGYASLSWNSLEFKAGTFPQIKGVIPHPDLSTGSMAVSGNARPLPMIQFSIPQYIPVPYTNENLHIMGGISHGWFTGDRLVSGSKDSTVLHEKWSYVKLGKPEDTNLYLGLVHEVMWGGEPMPVNWDNYWRVFRGASGGEDALQTDQLGQAGNTLGIWDLGFEMPLPNVFLHGYYHHYFELKHSLKWRNALDGLFGVSFERKNKTSIFPDTFVYEYFNTTYQGGPYHTLNQILSDAGYSEVDPEVAFAIGGGSHQYYSHTVYTNGWTHLDRLIGSSLVVPVGSGEEVLIASNRIEAWHFGFSGSFSSVYKYYGKATVSFHSPTIIGARQYAQASLVPENKKYSQYSFILGVQIDNIFNIADVTSNFALAADIGEIYEDSFGMEIGFNWRL